MSNLVDVLKDLDRRLSAVEERLQLNRQETKTVSPQISNEEKATSPSPSPQRDSAPTPSASKSNFLTADINASLDSSSVLAIIGIIFVVLAGVFFIKITIDSGWLTPIRQILLAAGAGVSFFLIPQFFPKAEREYGALLAGAGTTILHLTWLGAYFHHHILDANAALVCATLVGIFSLLANFDKGNRVYVLVAMAGTYLSAPIVGYNTGELSILSIFLIIWNISFSAASLMNKRRDIMFIASYYAVFTLLLLSVKALNNGQQAELLILQLVQFVIFAGAMVSFSVYHKSPLTSEESVAVLPLLLLFYASTDHLISSISPDFAPWFALTLGAIVLGIYLVAQRYIKSELNSGPTLTSFAALTFVHSFYFQLLDESIKPMASILIGIAVMVLWRQSLTARKKFFWPLMILLSTVAYGAILTVISTETHEGIYFYNFAYGVLALIAVIGLSSSREVGFDFSKYSTVLLGFAHLEVMLGLYRLSEQISWSGALFVTITWGLYAAAILALAYRRQDQTLGRSALIILLAVSLKAFFYDVSNTSSLIRVVCLLAEGLLLYCCGWIFKKMQQWKA